MSADLSVEAALRLLTGQGYLVSGGPYRADDVPVTDAPNRGRSLCEGFTGAYSVGLHVGSLFLILGVSFLGTAIPILGRCIPWLVQYPFVFSVAKSAATGVLLSVSTIHLIYEGAMAFTEPCVPQALKNYAPLYFLLALIAVLLMQALDMQLAVMAERWLMLQSQSTAVEEARQTDDVNDEEGEDAADELQLSTAAISKVKGDGTHSPMSDSPLSSQAGSPPDADAGAAEEGAAVVTISHEPHKSHDQNDSLPVHSHQHLPVPASDELLAIRRVISAICMEFGVALHSIFVGLTVGLTTDKELAPLIVALVFHQLFEGMAMGSRIADAKFAGRVDIVLALIFAFSAPAGMAVAAIVIAVSPGSMAGSGFVTLVAVLDSLCGGILLYLAFTLLLGDFVADVRHYCADGLPHCFLKKCILFFAVWVGMGMMALVGNWL